MSMVLLITRQKSKLQGKKGAPSITLGRKYVFFKVRDLPMDGRYRYTDAPIPCRPGEQTLVHPSTLVYSTMMCIFHV